MILSCSLCDIEAQVGLYLRVGKHVVCDHWMVQLDQEIKPKSWFFGSSSTILTLKTVCRQCHSSQDLGSGEPKTLELKCDQCNQNLSELCRVKGQLSIQQSNQAWRKHSSLINLILSRINSETGSLAPEAANKLSETGVSVYDQYQLQIIDMENHILVDHALLKEISYDFRPHSLIWTISVNDQPVGLKFRFQDQRSKQVLEDTWSQIFHELRYGLTASQKPLKAWQKATIFNSLPQIKDDESQDEETQDKESQDNDSQDEQTMENLNLDIDNRLQISQNHKRLYMNQDQTLCYHNSKGDLRGSLELSFQPSQMMLHQSDQTMLFRDTQNLHYVQAWDLNKEKCVEQYGAYEDWVLEHIAPTTKFSQSTMEPTLVGINQNSVYSLDPRQHGSNKLAHHYSYQTPPHFTCLATTEAGEMAVGNELGEIRLFSDLSKKAKTMLSGLGDPILALDLNSAGSLILATTSMYLFLINTFTSECPNGFQKSISKNVDVPIKLQLNPIDLVKYKISEVKFTPGHFNTGPQGDQWILSSTGGYAIRWSLKEIQKGNRYGYEILPISKPVQETQFLNTYQEILSVVEDPKLKQSKLVLNHF